MINEELFYLLRSICIVLAGLMLIKYFIFLVVAPFYPIRQKVRRLRSLTRHIQPRKPIVSVIIPAWNEEIGILRTVRSLLRSTYSNIEIVVINDGSTDSSHGIVTKFLQTDEAKARHPHVRLKYCYQENGGKGRALNKGVSLASGDIIVTMDADSVFSKHAIERMVRYFEENTSIDALVGNVKVAHNTTIIGRLQQLEYLFGFYFKRAHCMLGAEYIFGGACAAFRRSTTFDKLGHFDIENKTEDIEMSMRTRFFGLKSVYAEDVICYTEGASTVKGLLNQRLRWKKGRFDTFAKYRALFFSTKKHHNKFLGWFILPLALLAEIQLLFEPIGIMLLLTYSFLSGDYISLTLGMGFIFMSYLAASVFVEQKSFKTLWWFPFTWPLFYLLVWIEYMVLLRSFFMFIRGSEIAWQRWQRKGVEVEAS